MIAAIVLTLDEEDRVKDCLKRLKPYVDYILVLDGGSKDETVRIAKSYADYVEIKPLVDNASSRNYTLKILPEGFEWVLFADADEQWDTAFLRTIKDVANSHDVLAYRFPRKNMPTLENFPDYQVRLLRNNGSIEWRGSPHDVPWHKEENKPVDQISVATLLEYPMIHLPRRGDIRRRWW